MGKDGKVKIGRTHQLDGKHEKQMEYKQSTCDEVYVTLCKQMASVTIYEGNKYHNR